jgi:hypothetical protein
VAQHRRDHRHHGERRRAKRSRRHHSGSGETGPAPGGPLMISRNRALMTTIAAVLVLGLIAFGVIWALVWS